MFLQDALAMLVIQERFRQRRLILSMLARARQWPAQQILLETAFQQDVRATLVSLG